MMITFARGPLRFNYRVVGIAINDGRVLLHRAETDDFWALPGGRAELMEPASVTLQREMQEELGIEVQVLRLHSGHFPWRCSTSISGKGCNSLPNGCWMSLAR